MKWQWLQHAFAVEPRGPAVPTADQSRIVERICQEVVRRRLTVPTLLFLETFRPLNLIGAQTLQFFSPWLAVIGDQQGHRHFAEFLERRGSIEYICQRIESLDGMHEA